MDDLDDLSKGTPDHPLQRPMEPTGGGILELLSVEQEKWQDYNFPGWREKSEDQMFKGVTEELGELAHALLKRDQGIRGDAEKHTADAKDAVGDMMIYLTGLCNGQGWDIAKILKETWAQVRQRDWAKNALDAHILPDG